MTLMVVSLLLLCAAPQAKQAERSLRPKRQAAAHRLARLITTACWSLEQTAFLMWIFGHETVDF